MKIRLLIPCLVLLATLFLQAKANEDFEGSYSDYSSSHPYDGTGEMSHEDFSSEHPLPPEEWDPEDYSYDEDDFDMEENYEIILEIVREIEEVYMQMRAEIEEYHNRNLSKVVNKLDDCVDIFNEAMGETEEEFPRSCGDAIRWGLKVFARAISLLEQRKCNPDNVARRCIPQEIADKYMPQLKDLYEELEEEILWDEDGVPDVCKYWEEWEDEDHPSISEEHDSSDLQ